jgi:sarcosine oxidase gamma subunit
MSNQDMRVEDALRKIHLLRRINPENGAFDSEAETATRLAQALMERYSIGKEDVQPVSTPRSRMTWVYWEQLLAEFGIALDRFGDRASASLGNGALIVIRLATGRWHVQQASPGGWKIAVQDSGLESLRAYLAKRGPRSYSLVG